jgi:hypothetical protein
MNWWVFVAGGVLGWLACASWTEGQIKLVKDTAKKESEEWAEEVKRLRTQVANVIGTEKPPADPTAYSL